jgi:hypothetical protein
MDCNFFIRSAMNCSSPAHNLSFTSYKLVRRNKKYKRPIEIVDYDLVKLLVGLSGR